MLTVLVVDDALADRALVCGLLKRNLDCVVLEARSGAEALDVFRNRRPRPHLVLTDLNMPVMDGLELVSELRENYPLTPVILMTAQGSEEIAAKALQAGAASYVPKRRIADDLAETVNRVLSATFEEQIEPQLLHSMNRGDLWFTLFNDPDSIRSLVVFLQQLLRCLPLGDELQRLRVGIAVEAALLNACLRGNLEIAHESGRDRSVLQNLIHERSIAEEFRDRRIHATIKIDREEAVFVIRDDGSGFDTAAYLVTDEDAADFDAPGRGITLMRAIMDDVRFNEAGNEVTLVKRRYQPPADEEPVDD